MRHKKYSSIGKDLTQEVYDPDAHLYITERYIDKIVLHCSATNNTKAYTAYDIDEWHRQRWGHDSGCGYHYVVLLDGAIQKGRWVDYPGAHVKDNNENTIGICYIGGLDERGRPAWDRLQPKQKESIIRLVTKLSDSYGLDPYNGDLMGHYEFPNVRKDCPCINMDKFRQNF